MTNFTDLIALVRTRLELPEPVSGGTDYLVNADIIASLNDAFEKMVEEMGGLNKYVEFTLGAAGTIAITKPTTGAPTVAVQNPQVESYPFYTVSNAIGYLSFENLTDPEYKQWERNMIRRSVKDAGYHEYYNETGRTRFGSFDVIPGKGFFLGPKTVTETNTIGITYMGKFSRLSVGDIVQVGTGLHDLSITGTYTGTSNIGFVVKIVTGGATSPNTFTLSIDSGATYAGTYNCSTAGTSIGYGLSVVTPSLINHVANDRFAFIASAPSLSEFKDSDMRGYPVWRASAECGIGLGDDRRAEYRGLADKALYEFGLGIVRQDATQSLTMANPNPGGWMEMF